MPKESYDFSNWFKKVEITAQCVSWSLLCKDSYDAKFLFDHSSKKKKVYK